MCLLYLIIHSEKFTGNAILIYGFIYVTEVLDPTDPRCVGMIEKMYLRDKIMTNFSSEYAGK